MGVGGGDNGVWPVCVRGGSGDGNITVDTVL